MGGQRRGEREPEGRQAGHCPDCGGRREGESEEGGRGGRAPVLITSHAWRPRNPAEWREGPGRSKQKSQADLEDWNDMSSTRTPMVRPHRSFAFREEEANEDARRSQRDERYAE